MKESSKREFLSKFYKSRTISLFRKLLTEIIGTKIQWLYFDSECHLINGRVKLDSDILKILKRLRAISTKDIFAMSAN